ncbi:MAG: 30S ribosomal protein S12 methylthiotransferase RimO [Acidimicrobiia bacterium]
MTGSEPTTSARSFHVVTLGCPKNAVDSDKVTGTLMADGLTPAQAAEDADVIVVNTCAFIEAARQESIDTVLALADVRRPGSRLVVTGCMAERHGDELAAALPEVDAVVGFGGEAAIGEVALGMPTLRTQPTRGGGITDLLDLPRPAPSAPWAYVKVAEGCDRACAFCAIPSFRGKQVSRTPDAILTEARSLVNNGVAELVLVAQDLAWFGRDAGSVDALAELLRDVDTLRADGLARVRLLYLYPSEVRDPLVSTMLELPSVVPYFDLSLQHASRPLLARMKRWGSGDVFLEKMQKIRAEQPDAAFRSNFIVGFPGETEADHETLLTFLAEARFDWAGFFPFSREEGTAAASLDGEVPAALAAERLRECSALQDPITESARDALIGATIDVLIDEVHEVGAGDDEGEEGGDVALVGRTHREAPEIDGVVHVRGAAFARPGTTVHAVVRDALGPDLYADVLQ